MAKKPRVMIYPAGMDINKVLQHNGIVLDNICTSLITDEELSPTGNSVSSPAYETITFFTASCAEVELL